MISEQQYKDADDFISSLFNKPLEGADLVAFASMLVMKYAIDNSRATAMSPVIDILGAEIEILGGLKE